MPTYNRESKRPPTVPEFQKFIEEEYQMGMSPEDVDPEPGELTDASTTEDKQGNTWTFSLDNGKVKIEGPKGMQPPPEILDAAKKYEETSKNLPKQSIHF